MSERNKQGPNTLRILAGCGVKFAIGVATFAFFWPLMFSLHPPEYLYVCAVSPIIALGVLGLVAHIRRPPSSGN